MTEGNVENWKTSGITEAQRKKLFALLSEHKIDKDIFEGTTEQKISELTKGDASECIDVLINAEDKIGSLRLWALGNEKEEKSEQKQTESPKNENKPDSQTSIVSKPVVFRSAGAFAIPDSQTSIVSKPKTEMVIGKAERMAQMYGIPTELANMFFMTLDGALYVKSPGLLYMGAKKGYARILTTSKYNEQNNEWEATTYVFPHIPKEIILSLPGLDKDLQRQVLENYFGPTKGEGRAGKHNVRMSTMHTFLKEMAETRSVNRALRLYTGYGGTSYEEMPEAHMELD